MKKRRRTIPLMFYVTPEDQMVRGTVCGPRTQGPELAAGLARRLKEELA